MSKLEIMKTRIRKRKAQPNRHKFHSKRKRFNGELHEVRKLNNGHDQRGENKNGDR